jgi:hypothetical protein
MAKDPDLKVEAPAPPNAGEVEEQRGERIRQRAHELYVAHGQEDGHDLDEWLQAEAEISASGSTATEL